MSIYIAGDHRGFQLKQSLKQHFPNFVDMGATSLDPSDDYVDFGARAVSQLNTDDRAILICGSGHGMDIVANRYTHVRAISGFNPDVVKQGREHEDANVLIIPSDWVTLEQAVESVTIFLNTSFSNADRHLRRLNKLNNLDIRNR